MRAIISADWHLRDCSPEDLQLGLRLLDDAGKLAQIHKCKYVIVAGDFFHFKHRLGMRMLTSVYESLRAWKHRGVSFIIIKGNHDQPDVNDSEYTPLRLLDSVATIVNTTRIVEEDDCVIAMVPWFPPGRFQAEINDAAQAVLSIHKPRILISHVSVKEGKVSPSNTKINQPVRVEHLLPGIWAVYLGDYHAAQTVTTGAGSVHFLGAPRPTTHGDFDCLGMWLMTAEGKELLSLPSRYPAFKTWRVDSKIDLPLRDFDQRDKNRIYVSNKMMPSVSLHYPTAALILLEEEKIAVKDRLGGEVMSPLQVALRWRELKKLPEEPYISEIRRLLGGAQ